MKEPTRFVEQSPWETRSSSVRQKISSTCILWNLKVYYHAHNRPPLVPVLSQINPGHALISFSFKIHFTMILQCTSWFYKWCLSFRFPLLPCMCHIPCPSHPPWLDQLNNIRWVAQIIMLLNMQWHKSLCSSICNFSPSCFFLPLRSRYLPQHSVLKGPQSFFPQWKWPSFTPIYNNRYVSPTMCRSSVVGNRLGLMCCFITRSRSLNGQWRGDGTHPFWDNAVQYSASKLRASERWNNTKAFGITNTPASGHSRGWWVFWPHCEVILVLWL